MSVTPGSGGCMYIKLSIIHEGTKVARSILNQYTITLLVHKLVGVMDISEWYIYHPGSN